MHAVVAPMLETHTETEIELWLDLPHPALFGMTPRRALDHGQVSAVRSLVKVMIEHTPK